MDAADTPSIIFLTIRPARRVYVAPVAGKRPGVSVNERVVQAPPEQVFAVLKDGWSYSDWVVGTAHIRAVDPHWPQPGSRLYHKAGPWPLSVRDSTVVLSCTEPTELVVQPRFWPLGEATVAIRLEPTGDGGTRITMAEDFAAGPLRWVRTKVNDLALHYRNRESLRRLGDLAVRKHSPA
jgi:uncharacterized protein YndB with AHSA1/START domain